MSSSKPSSSSISKPSSSSTSKSKSSSSSSSKPSTSSISASTSSKPKSSSSSTSKSMAASGSSSSTSTKRLIQELSKQRAWEQERREGRQTGAGDTERSPIERLGPVSDAELFHWEAVINGRGLGGGYEGGRWLLDIRVPGGGGGEGSGKSKTGGSAGAGASGSGSGSGSGSYPNVPPVVKFVTRICAPNVGFETGDICLDLLKDAWTPAYTLKMTVEAIWQMLAAPGVDSPLNVDLAALLRQRDEIGGEAVVRWGCGEWRWEGL